MHDVSGTANLLGAAALAVTDLLVARATAAAGTSTSGASALVVLHSSAGLSVTELGRRIGLSQSAAARMVDALQADGLAERRAGTGRAVSVHLTQAGTRAVERLIQARAESLVELVAPLDDTARASLDELLGTLLVALYQRVGSSELLCRLCDRTSCIRGAACPVGEAARRATS
jgi:DNA-binding MarR family transcriptional regulator